MNRTRLLYLARHAEPTPDGSGLTDRGRRQAELLGERLVGLRADQVMHGPLPRARETARLVAAARAESTPLREMAAAGDYVPAMPAPGDVPDPWAAGVHGFLSGVTDQEAAEGTALAAEAVARFAGPASDGRGATELVITHAFTVGWLVGHALGAPAWRWVGQNHCHAGLTVIRYPADAPPSLVVVNDTSHLPDDLRWTGFPDELRT